jgi:hypothetical protein
MSADLLSTALSVLAGDPCLSIGQQLIAICKPIQLINFNPLGSAHTIQNPSTWRCEAGLFFTLIHSGPDTLLYSHANQMLYFASASASLPLSCPDGTAFLCQFALDRPSKPDPASDLPEPRLLAFDLVIPDCPPHIRGERLRSLGQFLPQPLCCIQWVGQASCLTPPFLARLPHTQDGILVLGPEPGKVAVAPSI